MMVGKVVEIVAGAILAKEDGVGTFHYFIAGPGSTRAFVLKEVNGLYGFEFILLTREGKQVYCNLSNVRAL